jgi:hypothetical protein
VRTISALCWMSAALAVACSTADSGDNGGIRSFTANLGWTCANGVNCQDVFDFEVTAGSVLTVKVLNVSSGSVAQIALYGPGSALGGINLFTGDTKELRCTSGNSCSDFTAGEHVDSYAATQDGVYRVAVTRDWGTSCGGTGTYRLEVSSSKGFVPDGQTAEDAPSLATGFRCQ